MQYHQQLEFHFDGLAAPAPRLIELSQLCREMALLGLRQQPHSALYKAYLSSDAWRGRRQSLIERARNRCERCGRHSRHLHIHHRTYVNLGHELEEDLDVLCVGCHETADAERLAIHS